MFEDFLKTLESLEDNAVSVPIDEDENGYIDKQCPSDECKFLFKVNSQDWEEKFQDEAVWCPSCRHEAPANLWFTIEQIEHAQSEAFAIVQSNLGEAMRSDERKFNRKQNKRAFISMSMSISGGGPRKTHTIPAHAAETMKLEIDCEECGAIFAVWGSAFFCPCCGHNSVLRTFSDSLRKIRAKYQNIEVVRTALNEFVGKDEAELTCRSLRETCISDGVVAFQKFCEGLYSNYGNPPFNAFQSLDRGSRLWRDAIGKGYQDWLSTIEHSELLTLFQKRHLLSHNEGIVDQMYLDRSGDSSYRVGQRIVIKDSDIESLLSHLEKASEGLKTECGGA